MHSAAAKSLQSCPTLCDPIDGSPPGSPAPGILQARTLEWVATSFSNWGLLSVEDEAPQTTKEIISFGLLPWREHHWWVSDGRKKAWGFLKEAGKQGSNPLFYWGIISFGSWATALSETSPWPWGLPAATEDSQIRGLLALAFAQPIPANTVSEKQAMR